MIKYWKYVIKNTEPLRIADDSTKQHGQTRTLRYIPGSTIRGFVIQSLSLETDFESLKKQMFSSSIRFLNAYPAIYKDDENKEQAEAMLPSPKGFYEDKTPYDDQTACKPKEIKNIMQDLDMKEGLKRASVGDFCYIKKNCIHYCNIKTATDMKIKMNPEKIERRDMEKDIFRNEYILPGHYFTGYIAVEDESEKLLERIRLYLHGQIWLGNARSAGMGRCEVVTSLHSAEMPYHTYKAARHMSGECYMLLLSDTVMRDENGEYCGLNTEAIRQMLNVESLKIQMCAASVSKTGGFNRKQGGRLPTVAMYAKGSVFRLEWNGELKAGAADALMDRGIGIRRNEGFGRVLFLECYKDIGYKQKNVLTIQPDQIPETSEEDKEVLQAAASVYYRNRLLEAMEQYIVTNPIDKGSVSSSQLGSIESKAVSYAYAPEEGIREIRNYLAHSLEKESHNNTHKERNSFRTLANTIEELFKDYPKSALTSLDDPENICLDQYGKNSNKYGNSLEKFLGFKTKHPDSVMGIQKEKLLDTKKEGTLKLQLLLKWIRYDNKKKEGEV